MSKNILPKVVGTFIVPILILTMLPIPHILVQTEVNAFNAPQGVVELVNKRTWSAEEVNSLGYKPDEIIVKFRENLHNLKTVTGQNSARELLTNIKREIATNVLDTLIQSNRVSDSAVAEIAPEEFAKNFIEEIDLLSSSNLLVIRTSVNDAVSEIIAELEKDPAIEYAEPNYIVHGGYSPNEGFYDDGQLWGFENDASTIIQGDADNAPDYSTNNPGTSEVDVQMNEAWDKLSGSESTLLVAVIDTGVDYDHEDLNGVMWDGSSCVDEDGSTLDDCTSGYDYVNTDKLPMDDNDHGTHIAGVIAAEHSGTDQGTLGVSKNTEIMAVKVLNASKTGTITNVIKGINFARENGADIINASYWSTSSSASEEDAIEEFVDGGGLFVTIAGNDNDNIDTFVSAYPAAYDLDGANFDNLITVTATDQSDEGATFSNYGVDSVDLGAPGTNILSTVVGDDYEFMNGTSMSAPFVSGTAALIWGYRPSLNAQQIKLAIMESGDDVADLDPSTGDFKTVSGNRLNAYGAILATEEALVVPTVVSTTGGGNWSSTSTWEGGVVPVSTDVVEINGAVTLNANKTIAGLLVNSGKTLSSHTSNAYTLTLSGANADVENNGTITDVSSGDLYLVVGGNLENNGTLLNKQNDVAGNLINTGTLAINTYVEGNVKNSGTISLNVILDGSTDQTIEGSGTFGYLTISNDAEVLSDITLSYSPTISSGKTLTIADGKTLTTNLGLFNSGTVTGGKIKMNGAGNQNISGAGPLNIDELWLADGTVKMYTNADLNGNLKISSGVILRPNNSTSKPNYTMDVDGDVDNDGTIRSYRISGSNYGELDLSVSGNIDNSGSMLYDSIAGTLVDMAGNLTNSGTWSINTNVEGDANNTGTVTRNINFDGTSAQTMTGAGTYSSIGIVNDTSTTSDISLSSGLTVISGNTFTIGNTYTLTANGGLYNGGTLDGDTFKFNGANQYFGTCGTIDLTSIIIDNGTTKLNTDCELTADVTVETGATLQANYVHRTLTIHGDLTVNGTTQDYSGDRLYIYLDSDLDNNGTMNHYRTHADWEPVVDADSYEFQLTDTSDIWQTESSTGTNTHSIITAYETDDRRWRWRSIDDGTPSAWSSDKYIN